MTNTVKVTKSGGASCVRLKATGASIDGGGKIEYGAESRPNDGVLVELVRTVDGGVDAWRADLIGFKAKGTREKVTSVADPKWKNPADAFEGFVLAVKDDGPGRAFHLSKPDRVELLMIVAVMGTKMGGAASAHEPAAADPVPTPVVNPAPPAENPKPAALNGSAKKGSKAKK